MLTALICHDGLKAWSSCGLQDNWEKKTENNRTKKRTEEKKNKNRKQKQKQQKKNIKKDCFNQQKLLLDWKWTAAAYTTQ